MATTRTGPVTRDTSTVALGLAQIRVADSLLYVMEENPVLTSYQSIGALASTKYSGNVDYWKLESGFPKLEDMSIPLRETASLECAFQELSFNNASLARGLNTSSSYAAAVKGAKITSTAGTTDAALSIAVDDSAIFHEFTVEFTGSDAGTIKKLDGTVIHTFNALNAEMAPEISAGVEYFTIPADFFTGTWTGGDSYKFTTVPAYTAATNYSNAHQGRIGLGTMKSPDFIRMEAVYTYPNGVNTMTIIFPRANVTSSMEIDLQAEDAAAPPITFEAKRADSDTYGGHTVWDESSLGAIVFA